MRKYIKPSMEFSNFDVEDIMTTSSGGGLIPGEEGDATGGKDQEWLTSGATSNMWAEMLSE